MPEVRQQEALRERDYKSLVNAKHAATYPHVLKKWINEKEGIKLQPSNPYNTPLGHSSAIWTYISSCKITGALG